MPEYSSRCDPAPPESHKKVAALHDGQCIALGRYCSVVASGDNAILVRLPDLREVETILNVEIYTDPATYADGWYSNKQITGNVVGVTIWQINAGTTLTVEVVAVGPP